MEKFEKAKPGIKFGKLTLIHFDKVKRKWYCKCDCGGETFAHITDMKSGKHLRCQCGIFGPREHTRLPNQLGMKNKLYTRYITGAKKRNISFNLSFDEVVKITQQNCFYCGSEPLTELTHKSKYEIYLHNGIDRVDNDKGYETDNVVPCCYKCNYSKKENSLNDWKEWIIKVYNNMNNNGMFNDQSKDVDSSESKWETPKLGGDMV